MLTGVYEFNFFQSLGGDSLHGEGQKRRLVVQVLVVKNKQIASRLFSLLATSRVTTIVTGRELAGRKDFH